MVRAAALIVASRRRFVGGTGKSYAYASLLAAELSEGLSNITVVADPTVRPVDLLADVRESDVLVTFSFRRYGRGTVNFAREFVARGGSLVAVTDDPAAPVAAFADVTITVSTESVSFTDSPTAVCAVVHLLSTLTTASAKGARRRLAERDAASAALGMYWDTPTDTTPGEHA